MKLLRKPKKKSLTCQYRYRPGFWPLNRGLTAASSTMNVTTDDGDDDTGNLRDGDGYGNNGDGDASHSWYGASELAPSRVRHHSGHGTTATSFDVGQWGLMALIQTGLAKLKTIKFLVKLLLILAIKLKLLTMLKMFLFTKFFVIGKLLKVFLLPLWPGLMSTYVWPSKNLTKWCTTSRTVPDVPVTILDAEDSGADVQTAERSTEPNGTAGTEWFLSRLARSVESALSARCVQRTACHAAVSRPPSLESILTNG